MCNSDGEVVSESKFALPHCQAPLCHLLTPPLVCVCVLQVTLRGKVGLIPDNFVELLSTPEAVEPSIPQPKLPPISKEVNTSHSCVFHAETYVKCYGSLCMSSVGCIQDEDVMLHTGLFCLGGGGGNIWCVRKYYFVLRPLLKSNTLLKKKFLNGRARNK